MNAQASRTVGIPPEPDPRRWVRLAVIVAAQFMVVLDVAIVNVALPTIKTDLHFSQTSLQWVVTAYSIFFGGVLLLGGRMADLLGRTPASRSEARSASPRPRPSPPRTPAATSSHIPEPGRPTRARSPTASRSPSTRSRGSPHSPPSSRPSLSNPTRHSPRASMWSPPWTWPPDRAPRAARRLPPDRRRPTATSVNRDTHLRGRSGGSCWCGVRELQAAHWRAAVRPWALFGNLLVASNHPAAEQWLTSTRDTIQRSRRGRVTRRPRQNPRLVHANCRTDNGLALHNAPSHQGLLEPGAVRAACRVHRRAGRHDASGQSDKGSGLASAIVDGPTTYPRQVRES